MELLGFIIALLLSFYLLAKITDDFFIESLDQISSKLKLSSDAAGATLMAVGSSAPELFVAVFAIFRPGDHGAIGIANIVGSALFNLLVITGTAAIIRQATVSWKAVSRDLSFYTISILVLIYSLWDGSVSLFEAILFIGMYAVYVVVVICWQRMTKDTDTYIEEDIIEENIIEENNNDTEQKWWKKMLLPIDFVIEKLFPSAKYYYLVFFMSIIFIAALSWVLVESAIGVSHILEIPEFIVALVILAAGTSVPDLISSAIVAKQGRAGMAISNAVGSNIFDILIGLGLPFILIYFISGEGLTVNTSELKESILILLGSVLILFILMIINKWNIGKKLGYFLIFIYVAYVIYEIISI